ncbi:MAG: hypothetical protein ACI4CT_02880 [Lachnospiraceae bacterium]
MIMTKTYLRTLVATMLLSAMCLVSCDELSDNEDKQGGNLMSVTEALKDGMIKITKHIGDWDAAVLYAEDGYIMYKNEVIDETRNMDYIQIQSPDADYDCAIFANSDNSLPELMAIGDELFFFYNDGDSIISISHTATDGVEQVDSIPYTFAMDSRSQGQATITYKNSDDKVQRAIKSLNTILQRTSYASDKFEKLKKALDDIVKRDYHINSASVVDSIDLCKKFYDEQGDSVVYCVAAAADKDKVKYRDVKYSISVETRRPIKVEAHTAVVAGRISCVSENFRKLGTWGVIYSTDRHNLSLDNNEGIVYANSNSNKEFRITLSGLKASTKYYYKAFYKFNSKNHGDLRFSYGDPNADSYVDNWDRSFTTKDSTLCPDNHHPHAIDLGLPSGTKWACCNVGASTPEGYGGYYAWGETSEKNYYDRDNYAYYNPSTDDVINIGSDIAGTTYDVAHVQWGGSWTMPSLNRFSELIINARRKWTKLNGVNGILITGLNGGQIFLPATGWRILDNYDNVATSARYWSSTLSADCNFDANFFGFDSNDWGLTDYNYGGRCSGFSVRAVCP